MRGECRLFREYSAECRDPGVIAQKTVFHQYKPCTILANLANMPKVLKPLLESHVPAQFMQVPWQQLDEQKTRCGLKQTPNRWSPLLHGFLQQSVESLGIRPQ